MVKKISLLSLFVMWSIISCMSQSTNSIVLLETNMGNIKLMLYGDTPRHRQNFLQLVENKHFDGTLFYRVIDGFVIQGGSQDSRDAAPGANIGYGDANRTIESEFKADHFHKYGALAAPRQPDKVNIFKESDVSQFYIVHGRKYSAAELKSMEDQVNKPLRKRIVKRYLTKKKRALLDSLKRNKKVEEFKEVAAKIKASINFDYNSSSEKLEFTPQQRESYISVGGVPHLDKNYTVFGEVIQGFEVINKIAKLPTDKNDRPFTDVKMKVRIIKY